jgi:hypothetical protein
MKTYINHSGGCPGSDITWEAFGNLCGIKTISYSYRGHKQEGEFPYIMNTEELLEGWEHVKIAAETLKRPLVNIEHNPYVRNLLCRNWFQVKHSDSIFAIGSFFSDSHTKVNGGTGWAVQMGIDNDKNVYFFDQPSNSWYQYYPTHKKFLQLYGTPRLTENFAGIGTREINTDGENAIKQVLIETFK